MCGSFHISDAVGSVRDAPRTFKRFIVDERVKRLPQHVGGFWVPHKVHRQIDHVQQVDQGAAPRKFFGGEPASKTRNARPSNPLSLS